MKAVIQRVAHASVVVDGKTAASRDPAHQCYIVLFQVVKVHLSIGILV